MGRAWVIGCKAARFANHRSPDCCAAVTPAEIRDAAAFVSHTIAQHRYEVPGSDIHIPSFEILRCHGWSHHLG
jgi:hypothetical protein